VVGIRKDEIPEVALRSFFGPEKVVRCLGLFPFD
jgi:hypothetical protein